MDTEYLLRFLGALFAIMNPFMTLPMFLSLTDGVEPSQQRKIALATLLYSTVMCVVIAAVGDHVLAFFGITIDDFRIAGGLVLMMIAFGMLKGTPNSSHSGTPTEREHHGQITNIAFYPITFPLIVGPAAPTGDRLRPLRLFDPAERLL